MSDVTAAQYGPWDIRNITGTVPAIDTELPVAVALSDTLSNPTAPAVGAYLLGWNGTQWLRVDASAAGSMRASLISESVGGFDPGTVNSLARVRDEASGFFPLAVTPQLAISGIAVNAQRASNIFKSRTTAAITAGTPATIWTPASGKKVRVLLGQLHTSVAAQIILVDDTTAVLRSPGLAAAGVWNFDLGALGILSAAANNAIKINVSVSGSVGGWIGGTEE